MNDRFYDSGPEEIHFFKSDRNRAVSDKVHKVLAGKESISYFANRHIMPDLIIVAVSGERHQNKPAF